MSHRISLAEWDEREDGRWRLTVAAQGGSTHSWVVPFGPPDDDDPLTLEDLWRLLWNAQDANPYLLEDWKVINRVRKALEGAAQDGR